MCLSGRKRVTTVPLSAVGELARQESLLIRKRSGTLIVNLAGGDV